MYYAFPSDVNFTVLDGQVVEAVRVDAPADGGLGGGDLSAADLLGNPLQDSGFEAGEPEDLEPEATPTPLPQSPFITQDPAAIQQQLMANQMGVG